MCCPGEVFVVQWERVRLSGMESKGAFTFQAALHKTGRITFSYQEVGHASALCFSLTSSPHVFVILLLSCKIRFRCHWTWLSQTIIRLKLVCLMPTWSSRQVRACNYACPLVYRAAIWRYRTKNYHYLSPRCPPYTDGRYETVYEYHRFEINTTKITNLSAVEFTALPSEWSSCLHCHI